MANHTKPPARRAAKDLHPMFRPKTRQTATNTALGQAELVFHTAVYSIRKSHGNAIYGLLINIFQTMLMIGILYALYEFLNLRRTAIRGNYILYMMSGVFLFMCHVKTMGAVLKADGPTSPMMKHAPMNTLVSIAAAALGSLYTQVLTMVVVLYGVHVLIEPVSIDDPVGAMGMVMLCWISGVAIGMVFRAARPWHPEAMGVISAVYMRANMIASGKMFVANMMPGYILWLFDWNPLFHAIDQGRGFIFLNYFPHHSSISYPIWVTIACLMLGLIGEFYTRMHASISWTAGR